ncbi:hypothetical protein BH11VER1_BH11VER1_17930 [soil metagenome]
MNLFCTRCERRRVLCGCIFFLVLLLSIPLKVAAATDPLRVPPIQVPEDGGKLTRDQLIWQTKWLEGKLQEKFVRRHQNAPWLKESQEYIHEAAPFLCYGATKNINTGIIRRPSPELLAQGRKLVAEGCDDPVFCYLVVWIESFMGKASVESMQLLSTRWRSLIGTDDPAVFKAMATAWLWYVNGPEGKYKGNPELRADCEAEMPGLIANALEETSDHEDGVGVYLALYASSAKKMISSKHLFMKERIESCKGPAWLVDTLLGEAEVTDAWEARGSGWASEVSKDGWTGFEAHLTKAREYLTRAWMAKPDVPWAATEMITVTMAGHGVAGVDERMWFDRATAAIFDHEPAYTSLLYAYRPRWGGSHDLMLAFGKACADTKRYDTMVPSRLFYAVSSVVDDLNCKSDVYKDPDLGRRIVELQRAMLDKAKGELESHYLRSFLVSNAFLTGDFETAAMAYAELKGKPIHDEAAGRLSFFGIRAITYIGMLELYADKTAFKTFQEAEEAYLQFDLNAAQELYQKVLMAGVMKTSKAASELVRMRLAATAVEKRMALGDWVTLSNEEKRLLWMSMYNNWQHEADGVITMKNQREGSLGRIILNVRTGLNFEVRGQLKNGDGLHHSQIGVVLGYRWDYVEYVTAVAGVTRGSPMAKGAALVRLAYDTGSSNPPSPAEINSGSAFRLQVMKGVATFWIDEKEVLSKNARELFSARDPWSEDDPRQNLFGLGCNYFPKGETRFRDIQLRLLQP